MRFVMKKKGQVSVFIIISLIIVAVIIGFLVFSTINKGGSSNLNSFEVQSETIQKSVLECMEGVYKTSLNNIGERGGYYLEPLSPYIDTGEDIIPFYYFDGIEYVPGPELIEEELANSIRMKNLDCLNTIDDYNLEYSYKYKSTNVSIKNNTVEFLTNLDLTLTKDNSTILIEFKENPIIIKSSLTDMISLSSYITYSHEINQGSLCLTCFVEIANDKELFIEIADDYEDAVLFNIVDNRTEYNPQLYSFFLSAYINESSRYVTFVEKPKTREETFVQEKEITKEEYDKLNLENKTRIEKS